MSGLFLAPATNRQGAYEHFNKTVLEGVSSDLYSEYTNKNLGNPLYVWGITSSFKPSWDNVNEGDWVLFYTHSNEYRWAARVKGKEQNQKLGETIREKILDDVDNERDWNLLLFFEPPTSVSASGSEIADLFNYGHPYPVRFIRVTEERMELLINEYGDIESYIDSIQN